MSTDARLQALLEKRLARAKSVRRIQRGEGPRRASPAQERMLFLEELRPGAATYHVVFTFRLDGPLDAGRLEGALRRVERRHEILRTVYERRGAEEYQVVGTRSLELRHADQGEDLDAQVMAEFARPFDLRRGPVWRALLLRASDTCHHLVLTLHHIAFDASSIDVLLRELADGYAGLPDPAPLAIQYADFAAWQRERDHRDQLAYWTGQLADASARLDLPADRAQAGNGRAGLVRTHLDTELTAGLHALARRSGATSFMVLLACFQTLLHRYSGQSDIVVGTSVAGRTTPEVEPLIGLFVNTVALRSTMDGRTTFAELLGQVRTTASDGFSRQDVPFETVVGELPLDRDLAATPVFQVLLNWITVDREPLRLGDVLMTYVPRAGTGAAKFELTLEAGEDNGRLELELEYDSGRWDEATARRLLGHLTTLTRAAVADPARPIGELPLMDAAELELVTQRWPGWAADYGHPPNLGDLSGVDGAAIALVDGAEQVTFAELDRRANRLAHHLVRLGAVPDRPVGVLLERSAELVVALLGVLRAGAPCLPLDPDNPDARSAAVLEDAGAALVVTDAVLAPRVTTCATVVMDEVPDAPDGPPEVHTDPDDLAYVFYTSGSTGRPKGVMISHRAAHNQIRWQLDTHGPAPRDAVLFKTTVTFDVSVTELFTALHAGARLIVAEPGGHRDPAYLRRLIAEHGVTRAHFVPTMLAALVAAEGGSLASLELVESAGEPMPPELRDAFLTATDAKLLNAYGPTETTVLVTAGDTHLGESAVPIGHPIANSPCYVLDENLNPQPIGVPGELCIGGAQLARGYLGRPDRTAESFVPDPFGGARLYRSGDRARWLPDGQLECLGRIDHQVKLRGHRIELGEVEAVLAEHDAVDQAVVVVHGDQLAAYLLGHPVEPRVLRDWLAARLPAYLVPASYTQLDRLPQTSSGKVDRGKLPAPTGHAVAVSYVEPATPVERQLAEIWREVLGVERVGREDDFFALGGHSLLAVQMIGRIRETLGVPVPLRLLFETPTIGRLADRLAEVSGPALPAVEPAADRTRLSAAEARLWFVDQLSPGDPAYNLPAICRLHGPLDVDALTTAIRALTVHEALRTAFPATDGRPIRALADTPIPVRTTTASSPKEVEAILKAEAAFRFDLATGPLARATLITVDASEHVLALVFHHSIVDGSSIGVLLDDLRAAYAGHALPERRLGAADYAAWQHELDHSAALDYWRTRLADLPPAPDLPADGPREPGSAGAARHFTVPAAITGPLAALAAAEGATPFMGLLAGYAALLSRYTGQDDLVLTMPVTDRARPELEDVVGLLLNTVVLRLDTTGTYRELLHRVRDAVLAAYEHRTLPFDRLVGELGLDGPALTRYSVTLDPSVASTTDFADDVVLEPEPFHPEHTKADLNLLFEEDATGGWLVYRTGLFEAGRIERLIGHLHTVLGGALADPDVPLADLPVLTAAERAALTPEVPAGPRRTLPELFTAQAARTPDAPAVPGLTYRQLDERANRFAHHLLSVGARGKLIALSLERGPDQAVAILGTWRAGCAYLALDPHHPETRRRDLVEDSGAALVVDELIYADNAEPPLVEIDPDDLAYLVYTSGSTGRPKGVRTPHAAAAEYLADYLGTRFGLGPGDTVLQLASLPFDAAIRDLFGPLTTGARVVLLDHEHAADPEAILDLIDREKVTCLLSVVPTLLRALLAAAGTGHGQHLRLVLTAGEALDLADRARTREVFGGRPLVVNQYGPTEATMTTTAHAIVEGTEGPAPLGLPVAGARLWIVDRHGDLAPLGVPGEVWIGGSRLAQGYHHRPNLTAERFVPDPFAGVPGARAYRTGDLARWDGDGSLRFLGRLDDQVKIRGNRVEPAGVENVLRGLPGVGEAAVVATGNPVHLAAYVTPATLDGDALRDALRGVLPEYQVPSWIQALAALPRTANNKVDKKALAALDAPVVPSHEARTPTEAVLASLFDELLGAGGGDDFFARGGHSLLAAQLAARIRRRFGVSLPLRTVLDTPTVTGLAAWLDNQTGIEVAASASGPAGELTLTQRAILDHSREHPGTAAYHVGFAAMFDGPLDETALVRAVDATVARHEILRTRFTDRAHVEPNVLIRVLRREARDEAEATALAETELRTPFDLENGPPIRATLIRCGADRHLFALTAHHIAADGWTLSILQRDLTEYYNAQLTDRPPQLPPATPYRGAPTSQSDVDYWTARLAHVPAVLDLPTDHPRGSAEAAAPTGPTSPDDAIGPVPLTGATSPTSPTSLADATRDSVEAAPDDATRDPSPTPLDGATRYFDLEPATTAAIRELAADTGTTEFMVLLAATQRWLHEQTGQERFRIAVPVSNRPDPATEHNAGPYANLLALPADLTGRPAFRTLLTRVRDTVLDAWEHQHTPYEALGQPRCQVMFGMQNLPSPADDLTGLTTTPLALDRGTCRYELHLRCYETPGGLAGWLEHNTTLFTPDGIERRLTHFLTTLHRAVTEPGGR
ncbi:non-ribosomal peptide synthetase [Amycolatopsis sp. 195334CR]|uniref:non-ribosomal peptide synthetase n=1 Tax=Amycolatopsis sp. 195334CR TaxID=2814588 RepID=UPI001A907FE8|nr:non-ribosomal peptide synthetase [Amycolatopsis sp. 195334CR]MBN6039847.1 amino acid adenylation domain-containing protein [Amycolatopsis sp. 195334CR]